MRVAERLRKTQRSLELVAAISAALWAAAAGLLAFESAGSIASLLGASAESASRAVALPAAVAAAIIVLWRARFVWTLHRVALWIEERVPDLRYSLVTAAEAKYSEQLEPIASPLLGKVDTGRLVRRAALRSLRIPVAALVFGVLILLLVPAGWTGALSRSGNHGFARATNSALLAGSRLTPLSARVVPPSYSRLGSENLDEPSTISGLQGSRVILSGRGSAHGLTADLSYSDGHEVHLPVSAREEGWTAQLVIGDTIPALIELGDRDYRRAIVLNPRTDAPPKVELRLPARDTALRAATGTLRLAADVSDDLGLSAGQFEYIVSSGSEETFTFKQGIIGAARFNGERQGTLTALIPYSFFNLGEGDRLSIRAVAADLNSLSGPGKGFSETRTIRVARKDEYDSLAVDAAAPNGDTAMLSLRMLIIETQKLDARRPNLVRDTLVARSHVLARQTDDVRASVLPLEKEEGTSTPEVTMDTEMSNQGVRVATPVRAALNDLEEASRKLEIADPHSALAPMQRAYNALQSLRNFKRYYFRGATRPVIVDIQRVRLTGKTKGAATPMTPRPAATSDRDRMRAGYSEAVEQFALEPKRAIAGLALLRVESLREYPALASALGDALDAIAKGRDATPALVRARRLLEGSPVKTDSIPAWSGGW